MSFKVDEHFLVPKHSLLNEEEAKKVLDKLSVSLDKMPAILKSDPAIKKLKAKVGDIVKIERQSPTAGKTVYYRVVR